MINSKLPNKYTKMKNILLIFFLFLTNFVNAQQIKKIRKQHFNDTLRTVKLYSFHNGRVSKKERIIRNDTVYIVEYNYDSLFVTAPPKVTVWYLKKSYPGIWREVMVGVPMFPVQGRGRSATSKDYVQMALNNNE